MKLPWFLSLCASISVEFLKNRNNKGLEEHDRHGYSSMADVCPYSNRRFASIIRVEVEKEVAGSLCFILYTRSLG
jgi:hypothetical protein